VTTKYFNVKNGLTAGNITLDASSGNISTTNISVSNKSDLGNVGNVKITGGSSGQLLRTDGLGNLSWSSSGGGGGGFFYVGTRTTPVQITVIMGNLIIGSRSGNIYVPVI